jgi:hypothetical protein
MANWKVLPGTYEQGSALKLVPVDRNDPRYLMFFAGKRHKHGDLATMSAGARAFAEHVAALISNGTD